jgi:membrane-bound serine protease (ClpP class)
MAMTRTRRGAPAGSSGRAGKTVGRANRGAGAVGQTKRGPRALRTLAALALCLPALLGAEADAPKFSRAVLIRFEGSITPITEQYLYRKLDDARRAGADLVIVEIDSPGGLLDQSIAMAERLRDLEARTVAYVPRQAISGGAIVALGCDEIVMAPAALLGDAGPIFLDHDFVFRHAPEKTRTHLVAVVRGLAEAKGRPPALAEAMVDLNVVVFEVKHRGEGTVAYMSEAELDAAPDRDDWEKLRPVHESREGSFLEVNGVRAVELSLAQATVDHRDELKQRYGLDKWIVLQPTAVDAAISLLNRPLVTGLLFVVGAIALYVELSSPGIGLGGLVAGLCFAIFFWSRFLGGTAGWLEIMLFVAGLCFLAVELFVLPGFGVAGVSGILLILVSLIMAGQSRVPQTRQEWMTLTANLAALAGAMVVGAVAVYYLSRHFGRLPILNRLVLAPPGGGPETTLPERPAGRLVEQQPSGPLPLGSRGVAISPLRPAGKARFGRQLADVVTDGDFIERDAPIEVTEVLGNRVVVRRTENP